MKPLVIPFFIPHQGCPHRCVFCDQEKIAGGRGIIPDADSILARIDAFSAGAPGRAVEIAFFGGTFTSLPRYQQDTLLDPLQPLLASGAVASVRLSTRPDAISAETATFLKSRGVETVELGVQSMDDEVLKLSGRGHSAADVERAFAVLRRRGLKVGAQLMPGLPGDSRERSLASLDRVLALEPSCLRIYPTLVLSGTELAARYQEGSYHPLELDEAVSLCKEMLLAALRRKVAVLRLGLQPTAELESPGVLLAGPYHPAFGQLVESELYFDAACRIAHGIPSGSRVVLGCHPSRVSDVVGQKRVNLDRLKSCFGVDAVAREDDSLPRTAVTISWDGGERGFDVLDL